jgi:hypothetical protein
MEPLKVGDRRVLERHDFPSLFRALHAKGYQVVGPTVRDGAIVYDHLSGVDDLPIGWTDVQSGGKYRLERRKDEALFGYTVGRSRGRSTSTFRGSDSGPPDATGMRSP